MSTASIVIPAATAIIIQGIQAWIAMARLNGLTEEELEKLFLTELDKFNQNTPDKLPDA
jgi:hypothetical protein